MRALREKSRFTLGLDIAARKITIPTKFCPDDVHETRLLLDLGNLMLRTQDLWDSEHSEEKDMYLQFNLVLSDVSAFLVDGDYHWSKSHVQMISNQSRNNCFLPVIDKCGIVLKLQQIQLENPFYPSTRVAVQLPSLRFHFSPARYHRLMQVVKVFQVEDSASQDTVNLWNQADFEGWLSVLTWKDQITASYPDSFYFSVQCLIFQMQQTRSLLVVFCMNFCSGLSNMKLMTIGMRSPQEMGVSLGGDKDWARAVSELAQKVHAFSGEFEAIVAGTIEEELARPCRERTSNSMQWMHCLAVTGLLLESIDFVLY